MANETLFWVKDGFGHVYGPFSDIDEAVDYGCDMELAGNLASAWSIEDNPDEDYSDGAAEDFVKGS